MRKVQIFQVLVKSRDEEDLVQALIEFNNKDE